MVNSSDETKGEKSTNVKEERKKKNEKGKQEMSNWLLGHRMGGEGHKLNFLNSKAYLKKERFDMKYEEEKMKFQKKKKRT